ncbi:MAG: hypothetical protein K1X28_01525 [Parachlamydiales bacterium]|nr:hypothetical protein [Parachlamydiales bacterium]
MSWIQPIQPNMDISLTILEGKFENSLIDTAQKIAIYTVIPFMMIAILEALIKNFILIGLANCAIAVLNSGHCLYQKFCTSP